MELQGADLRRPRPGRIVPSGDAQPMAPMKKVAHTLRRHRQPILNRFVAKGRYNCGIIEGLNAVVQLRFRKAPPSTRQKRCMWCCITHLATSPNENSPTDFAEAARKMVYAPVRYAIVDCVVAA